MEEKRKMEMPDLSKTNEWLKYLKQLKAEKKELETEKYTATILINRTDEEIEKVEVILDALENN